MGKISNYLKEVKTEVKQAMEDEKEDKNSQEFKDNFRSELEETFSYEKASLKYIGLFVLFTLFLGGMLFGLTYLAFHKQFMKSLNTFVEKIEPEGNQQNTPTDNGGSTPSNNNGNTNPNNNGGNNSNSNGNNNSNSGNNSSNTSEKITCNKQVDGIYKYNKEQLYFMLDGELKKKKNDQYDAFGNYTLKNQTITVTADLESDIMKEITITYTISKDCKKITEQGTNKVFVRQ